MADLQTISGASLVTNIQPFTSGIADIFQQRRTKQEQEKQKQQLLQGATRAAGGDTEALARLALFNPQAANAITQALERNDQVELEEGRVQAERSVRNAILMQSIPFDQRSTEFIRLAQEATQRGDIQIAENTLRIANLPEAGQNLELQKAVIINDDIARVTKSAAERNKAIVEASIKAKTPTIQKVDDQLVQLTTNDDGTVSAEVIFTGEEDPLTPNPQNFFNPQTGKDFTVDINNREEVEAAQAIGAFKRTAKGPTEPKPPSTAQSLASGFAVRLKDSSTVIDEVGSQFVGLISRGAGILPEGLKSDDRQRFEQAERNFINATLRRESGAAINESEFVSARLQYIPQPGNSDAVLAQKKRNREVITKALELEAGPAFAQLESVLSPTVTIKGQQFQVGQVITNAKGQKARVEQDGSLTAVD